MNIHAAGRSSRASADVRGAGLGMHFRLYAHWYNLPIVGMRRA
jgi:hypothetical protein